MTTLGFHLLIWSIEQKGPLETCHSGPEPGQNRPSVGLLWHVIGNKHLRYVDANPYVICQTNLRIRTTPHKVSLIIRRWFDLLSNNYVHKCLVARDLGIHIWAWWYIDMRQWTGSILPLVMACRLCGAKPLPKPMLTYWNFREIWIKIR